MSEDGVRNASAQFYSGLNRMAHGDASSMTNVWSHDPGATAMHPIGGRDIGWDAIRNSFKQVAELASGGNIELKDQVIQVTGDTACEIGIEAGHIELAGEKVEIEHRVTNIYRNEGGTWKLMHHHTDPSPSMLDRLSRL
jgi:ketosteroid isomerase-like protein